ncbi:MAG: ketoacyl-ACP synthase III [Rhizobiales bacterium]|nr:ketoacyl-ACP synthase III [Hyphomicrobiales bacterium]
MIGISEIANFVPRTVRDNLSQAASFGETEDFVRNRIGALKLPSMAAGEETSDLAARAVGALLEISGKAKEAIDCLVVCTQNPDAEGLPHTAAIVQAKCGLPKTIAAFDISLGCSGYVYGLPAVIGFMEATGLSNGILVTADPYSKIVDPADKNTALLFGDAATATLLARNPVFRIGAVLFGTDGSGAQHLQRKNGRLHMNGRQIFNFAALNVPAQIKMLLERERVAVEEVDRWILHQGSRYIVDSLISRMGLRPERVPIRLQTTGNTVSSSIPLILEESLRDAAHRTIVLSGFGVGLSWGSMLLHRI